MRWVFLLGLLACEESNKECQGFQYNNPKVELWEIKKTCSDSHHELASDGHDIVCRCK